MKKKILIFLISRSVTHASMANLMHNAKLVKSAQFTTYARTSVHDRVERRTTSAFVKTFVVSPYIEGFSGGILLLSSSQKSDYKKQESSLKRVS